MADLPSYGNHERDVEQALITLKKGTQLCKYSRKGKPKLCPFRVSADETILIWYSRGEERNLKLSSVTKIILGQRTAVFRRYLRPEKDYLSFSLIYNNGDRSLDLICKDPEEAGVWLAGLKAIISRRKERARHTKSEISDWNDTLSSSIEFPPSSAAFSRLSFDLRASSDVVSEHANMRGSGVDGFRSSVSSASSGCSSGIDDIESLGDVYVWGELWADGFSLEGSSGSFSSKIDILTPKPLECNVVLDVHQIACGVRHIGLVTRQGEVFTWGEESGGRLGHGVERDFSRPHLVEYLAVTNVDFVSCGEFHTAAISTAGDAFTWGDGTHNAGVLGHGNNVSHWIPKRISGPLEGIQVLSVACGAWHSGIITASGKLFTFGDGKFGVLGHGDRESLPYPKEVSQLSGLKTMKVACGVWHTAAIVEVMNSSGPCANMSSRKLFTWGDGDKYRLGHANKDTYLTPHCVSSLIEYSFHQIACGHTMTVALTTSGHVFTMGSSANGQLGNPQANGKSPCLVQEKLVGEFVEEIACGAYHVAVLTSRSEVFTWGKGANGRLGHGDMDDRRSPTLVEALKDRHVKAISCGSNFTATICIHKWVSGADQSVCSGCRQAFGFTRKRHNCYNCGLVHCHGCSSKKALKAALAPTPSKPHRVCDACYNKLKAPPPPISTTNTNRRVSAPRRSIDGSGVRFDRDDIKSFKIIPSPIMEPVKYLEVRSQRPGARSDAVSIVRASQVPALRQLKDIAFPSSLSALQNAGRVSLTAVPAPALPGPTIISRPASPYSRRPSPPRTGPTVLSRGVVDSLKKSNEVLSQEVAKLQNQVKTIRQKCKAQDEEIQKLQKSSKEASMLAAEQSLKCRVAKEVIKSATTQLKDIKEKIPADVCEGESFQALQKEIETFLNASETMASSSQSLLTAEAESDKQQNVPSRGSVVIEATSVHDHDDHSKDTSDPSLATDTSQNTENVSQETSESAPSEEASSSSRNSRSSSGRANEVMEQFEPGVYITYMHYPDGSTAFKRVRFSRRKFSEEQAGQWWKQNQERVVRRYTRRPRPDTPPPETHPGAASGEESSGTVAASDS